MRRQFWASHSQDWDDGMAGMIKLNTKFYLRMAEEDLKYGELTRKIIACAIRVHQELGSGFQEVIYQRAMEIELRLAGIAFHREFVMEVYYRNIRIGTRRVDFLVEDLISVEFKARTQI